MRQGVRASPGNTATAPSQIAVCWQAPQVDQRTPVLGLAANRNACLANARQCGQTAQSERTLGSKGHLAEGDSSGGRPWMTARIVSSL